MFFKKVAKDTQVTSFLDKIERGIYSMDVNKRLKEIEQIHASRIIHTLSKERFVGTAAALGEVVFENQQKRARIVSVKMECVRKSGVLTDKLDTITRYVKAKYGHQLQLQCSTQAERNDLVSELFTDAHSILARLKVLNDVIDIILNDIDQSGWGCSHIVKTLQIAADKLQQLG